RHGEGALADFFGQRLGAFAVADVRRDRGAALVQARCGSPSEAAPRTGHDGHAPSKISVFHPENCLQALSSALRSRMAEPGCAPILFVTILLASFLLSGLRLAPAIG